MLYLSFSISLLKRAMNVTFSLLDEHFGLYRTAVVALPLPSGKAMNDDLQTAESKSADGKIKGSK